MNLTNLNKDKKNWRQPTIDLGSFVGGKIPPQAKDLEEYILGAIMIEKSAIDSAAEILKPESFYVDAHQRVFKVCLELSEKGVQPDILTVVERLKVKEELDMIGGLYAVAKLTNSVVSTANLEYDCRIIQQKFIQRELIRISGETIGDAYEDSIDVFDLLDKHEGALLNITAGIVSSAVMSSQALSVKAMEKIDFLLNNKEQISGVPTGFPYLNKITNGWQPTDLIILAARPSVGKTAFALNLARNAACDKLKPTPVGFFSLEMSAGQLVNRILSTESQVHLEKISRGRLYDEDYKKVFMANVRFGEMPIFIDDTAALNLFEFRAKARRLVNKHKVGLIIIDYLQLMSGTGNGNREQEVSAISRGLKSLAKQLHVPIIALSQLSRAIETRKDKPEPVLSDLRESGAIEQDADMVMFLFRPDYQEMKDEGDFSVKGEAVVKIAKHRNGDLVKLPFKTDLSIQTWFDPEQYDQYKGIDGPASFKFETTAIYPDGSWKKLPPPSKNNAQFDEGYDEPPPF